MRLPRIIGDGVIPEAEAVRDVQTALAGRRDVVLLAHVAPVLGEAIPDGSIVYNLEPLFDGCRSFQVGYLDVLRRFPVWDYQRRNVKYLAALGIKARHVPYRYTRALERALARSKDIDVLFVGSASPRRRVMLDRIGKRCAVTEAQGVYGRELDLLIARAKVVVNIHYCDEPHPLEVVRLNYLMANGCCVVSERGWDEDENEAYAPGLIFADDLAEACEAALQADRASIEQAARRVMRSMPMEVPQ